MSWVIVVFPVLIILFDIVGLHSATQKVAETAFHRALILFETKTPAPITVVVIDEASARRFNRDAGYPITFAGHATILSSILCSGPSSIFIDLAFRSLRLKQGAYADVDAAGIPNEFNDLLTNLELRPGAEGLNCPLLNGPNGRSEPAPIIGVAHIVDAATRCDPFSRTEPPADCRAARVLRRLRKVTKPVPVSPLDPQTGGYALVVRDVSGRVVASPALRAVIQFCRRSSRASDFVGCRDIDALEALLKASPDNARAQLVPQWRFFRSV
ncbi:MAG: hypothetical protein AAFQ44_12065, partial [Pseudomonadota bacterium]